MPADDRKYRLIGAAVSGVPKDIFIARPGRRRRLAGLVGALALTIGLAACSSKSTPSSLVAPAAEAAAAPADDASFAGEAEAAREEDADEALLDAAPAKDAELALADYERLLVEQELRLRAAGVPLAGEAEAQVASKRPSSGAGSGAGAVGGATRGDNVPRPEPPATKPSATSRPAEKKASKAKTPSRDAYGAGKAGGGASFDASGDACLTICDLAASTCDLADRICGLADRHPDEERYGQVCGRAREDCRMASQACEACAA